MKKSSVVRNLQDVFSWPRDYFESLFHTHGVERSVKKVAAELQQTTYTTAFSGVCAPSVALEAIKHSCNSFGENVAHPQYVNVIEWDREAQMELCPILQDAFSDITGFAGPEVRKLVNNFTTQDYSKIKETIFKPNAVCMEAMCLRHKRKCRHRRGKAHFAGPPCTYFSPMGFVLMEQGKTS